MRKQLKFRPEIVAATRKTFKKVAKKMEVPLKKLTFVGVHNRYYSHLFIRTVKSCLAILVTCENVLKLLFRRTGWATWTTS